MTRPASHHSILRLIGVLAIFFTGLLVFIAAVRVAIGPKMHVYYAKESACEAAGGILVQRMNHHEHACVPRLYIPQELDHQPHP